MPGLWYNYIQSVRTCKGWNSYCISKGATGINLKIKVYLNARDSTLPLNGKNIMLTVWSESDSIRWFVHGIGQHLCRPRLKTWNATCCRSWMSSSADDLWWSSSIFAGCQMTIPGTLHSYGWASSPHTCSIIRASPNSLSAYCSECKRSEASSQHWNIIRRYVGSHHTMDTYSIWQISNITITLDWTIMNSEILTNIKYRYIYTNAECLRLPNLYYKDWINDRQSWSANTFS